MSRHSLKCRLNSTKHKTPIFLMGSFSRTSMTLYVSIRIPRWHKHTHCEIPLHVRTQGIASQIWLRGSQFENQTGMLYQISNLFLLRNQIPSAKVPPNRYKCPLGVDILLWNEGTRKLLFSSINQNSITYLSFTQFKSK